MNFKFRMKLNKKILTILILILLVAGAIVGCIAFFLPKLNKVEKHDKDGISFLEKQESIFPKSENLKSSGRGRVLKPVSNFQRHGCPNEDCVLSAAKMIKWINKSADPCEDFYNFACGNFAREYSLPEGWEAYSSVDVRNEEIELKIKNILEEPATINDSESMNNTKKVYASCMNLTHIEETSIYTLRQILTENRMGEWPLLDPEWKECHVDLEWRMAKLNALGIESLFSLDTEFQKDGNETLQAVMRVADPLIKDDCDDETSAGATEHRALLKAVLDIFEIVNVSDSDIDDVIRFDLMFCNATKDCRNREKKSPGNFYGRSTLYDLAKNTSQINWIRWRNLMFSYMNLNFPQDREFLYVDGVEHCIRNINDLLSITPSKVLGNYLAWKYVFHNLGFLSRPFGQLLENHHHLFQETYMNSDRWVPRWRKCVIFIEDIMPMALLKTYYQSYVNEGIEKEMDDIVGRLKEALKETGFEEWKHEIDLTEVAAVFPIKIESFYDKYYPTMYFTSPSFIEYGNNLMTMRMRKLMKGVAANKKKSDMEYAILKLYPAFRLNSPIFFQDDRIIVTLAKLVHTITTTLPKYNTLSTFGILISNTLARSIVKKAVYSENKAPPVIKKQNYCFSKFLPYPVSRSIDYPQDQQYLKRYDYVKYDYIGNIVAFKAYFDFKAKSISGDEVLPGLDYNAEKLFFISYAQEYCEIRKNPHSLGSGHHRVNSALKIFSSFSETFRCAANKQMNLAC